MLAKNKTQCSSLLPVHVVSIVQQYEYYLTPDCLVFSFFFFYPDHLLALRESTRGRAPNIFANVPRKAVATAVGPLRFRSRSTPAAAATRRAKRLADARSVQQCCATTFCACGYITANVRRGVLAGPHEVKRASYPWRGGGCWRLWG